MTKGPWAVIDSKKNAKPATKPTNTKSGPWAVIDKHNGK